MSEQLKEVIQGARRTVHQAQREAAYDVAWAVAKELKPEAEDREVVRLIDALEDFLG